MRIYERDSDGHWVWAEHTCQQYNENDFAPKQGFELLAQWASWGLKASLAVSVDRNSFV